MPRVSIQGYGVVNFPDSMTPDQIQAAIETDILPGRSPASGLPPAAQGGALPDASDDEILAELTPGERAALLQATASAPAESLGGAMDAALAKLGSVGHEGLDKRTKLQAFRDTVHNMGVALGEGPRGRERFAPAMQAALAGMPGQAGTLLRGLLAYDEAMRGVLPEDVRLAPEGSGAWERALTETALPGMAAFADPVNMGAMIAGGAAAAPVAGALGLGGVAASPLASAATRGAARAMQAGIQSGGALGAFGGVEAAQRGEGLGGIASAVGRNAALGMALGPAGAAPGGVAGKLLTEVGVFGLLGPAMEGRLPTEDDLVGAIVMIGGLNAARGLSPGAIRGLLKRREDRTPEETRAVEAIPPEQMEAIQAEAAQEIAKAPDVKGGKIAAGADLSPTPEAARLGEIAPPEAPIVPKPPRAPVSRETPAGPQGAPEAQARGSEFQRLMREGNEIAADAGMLAEERRWHSAVTTEGAEVVLPDGRRGKIERPAADPVNGLGRDEMALVDGEWYRATSLSAAPQVPPQAPGLPTTASEAQGTGKVPAPQPEAAQGAAEPPVATPVPKRRVLKGAAKAGPAKEPWQMTKAEFGVPAEPKDTEVFRYKATERIARERPADMTPEMQALLDKTKAQQRERSKYLRAHKAYLPKANEHFLAVQAAVDDGKPVPPEVLSEYPSLARKANPTESSQAGFLNLEALTDPRLNPAMRPQPTEAMRGTKPKRDLDVRVAAEGALTPIYSRAYRIAPDAGRAVRNYEYQIGQQVNGSNAAAKPFQDALVGMARRDPSAYTAFWDALYSGDRQRIAEVVEREGLQAQHKSIREDLDTGRQRAIEAGIEVPEIEGEYFPRRVRDYEGLMNDLGAEVRGQIGRALADKAKEAGVPVHLLDPEVRDRVVNSYLAGRMPPGAGKPGFTKPRTVEMEERLLKFYYRPEEAIAKHIVSREEAIARANLFGKGESTEGSIGSYVGQLVQDGKIKPEQEAELKNILLSQFNRSPMYRWLRDAKTLTYGLTLNSASSGITQVGDIAFSLYENGVYGGAKHYGRAILRKSEIRKEDIGVREIASEFETPEGMGKWLNREMKAIGLHGLDTLGKESLVNGVRETAHKRAKAWAGGRAKGYGARRFERDMQRYFGEGWQEAARDLAGGQDTPAARTFMFNKLLDYQPAARSEMPQFYLEHPNARPLYMLKSYTLKQLDAFRRESFDLMREGKQENNPQKTRDGLRNIVKLGTILMLTGASTDIVKDWMMGRGTPDPGELAWDNLLKLAGFSRYVTWQFRREGLPEALAKQAAGPMLSKSTDAWRDVAKIEKAARPHLGKIAAAGAAALPGGPGAVAGAAAQAASESGGWELDIGKFKTVNSIPIVGPWYYWWFGQGADIMKGEREKEARENAPPPPPRRATRSGRSRRSRRSRER